MCPTHQPALDHGSRGLQTGGKYRIRKTAGCLNSVIYTELSRQDRHFSATLTYQVASSPIPMLPSCLTDLRLVRERAIGEIPGNRQFINVSGFAGDEPNAEASHGLRSTSPTSVARSFSVFQRPTEAPKSVIPCRMTEEWGVGAISRRQGA